MHSFKIGNSRFKSKRKVLQVLSSGLLIISLAPELTRAAFDAPQPDPIAFSLANSSCFPDFLVEDSSGKGSWYLSTGGARLFEMPEIQPFSVRLGGPGLGGRWRLSGTGLSAGAYTELASELAYQRRLLNVLQGEVGICLLNVSIDEYGSAWSTQLNVRLNWRVRRDVELALAWVNLNDAKLGADHFPLPRRISFGGIFRPLNRAHLILEMEKDTRYPLQVRCGSGIQILPRLTLLLGFQSNPDIVSGGVSCLIGSIRATASFQYHPDLGISQCYGLVLSF